MAEIYRDSVGLGITLDIQNATVTKVVFKRDGVDTDGVHAGSTASLPYSITSMDGPFQIEWTYSVEGLPYTRVETHRVVTPLFKADDLAYDTALNSLSADQVVRLESLVRKVIESYTGQTFGYRKGYVLALGRGDNYLALPERAISLDDTGFNSVAGGFIVRPKSNGSLVDPNIKVPAQEEAYYYGYPQNGTFSSNATFKIYGEFGWTTVPQDVKEAALILAEDFSCDESMWRDRYIKSIRAADWRFDFNDGAFAGTGSLAADQLLAKYVRVRAVVI